MSNQIPEPKIEIVSPQESVVGWIRRLVLPPFLPWKTVDDDHPDYPEPRVSNKDGDWVLTPGGNTVDEMWDQAELAAAAPALLNRCLLLEKALRLILNADTPSPCIPVDESKRDECIKQERIRLIQEKEQARDYAMQILWQNTNENQRDSSHCSE